MIPNRRIYVALVATLLCAGTFAQDFTFPPVYESRIFPILGWHSPPLDYREYDRYYKAGFTIAVIPPNEGWNEIYETFPELDMMALIDLPEPRKLMPKTFLEFAKKRESSYGWFLKDEATPDDVEWMAEEIADYVAVEPGLKTMAVLDAREGIAPWKEGLPKLLDAGLSIVCLQSFHLPDSTETDEKGFYEIVSFAVDQATKHDVDAWAMIQVTPFDGYRRASESDIRLQSFTAVALGARGLVHYAYWDPPYIDRYKEWGPSMIEVDSRTGSYGYEMTFYVNREIRRQARHISKLDYLGHYYTGEAFEGAPTTPVANSPIKRVVAPAGLVGEWAGESDDESWALVVNRRHGHFSAASSTLTTIQIVVADDVTAVHEVDRQNEFMKPIPIENGSFFITTPGGTGNLLKFTRE